MTLDDFVSQVMADRHLFHFTDERNLPSIRESGLLSHRELARRNIAVPAPGGNDWSQDADQRYGLDDFVHLCLTDQHPMEFRARENGQIDKARYLRIQPQVMRADGVRFSLDVSNKAAVPIQTFEQAAPLMDIAAITTRMNWKDPAEFARVKAVRKYEILIPKAVPLNLLLGL